jgi:hypothetical protein
MSIKKKNSGLQKASGLTKTQQTQEIVKCGTDVKYFINNYVRISHPKRGLIKFKTFKYQDDCLDAFQKERRIIVNKSRQLGLSTAAAAYALWLAIFRREKTILVVATKLEVAKNFVRKVKTMYGALPEWIVMPSLVEDNKVSISFSNGSVIKAIPCSPDAGRSEALSLLIVDECAHIEGIDEMWLGMIPTMATGGSVIMISSPSGVGTLFHKIWIEAQKGDGEFFPIELPWTVHPERDQKWFDSESKAIIQAKGERGVAQELMCSFNSSGDTFLNGDIMDRIFNKIKPPSRKEHCGKYEAWLWKPPIEGHKYIISADVARGDGQDYSAFHVIDTTSEEVVADYIGKLPADSFADLLVEYGRKYNTALICQELNNVGIACAIKLKNSGYTNLWYEKFQKNIYMSYANQSIGPDDYPGFTTNPSTREQILAKMEFKLRNNQIKIRSKRLFEEFQTFVWKGNKPQAQKGHNDDLIMSLAIGLQLFESTNRSSDSAKDAQWALIRGMSRDEQDINPLSGQTSLVSPKPDRTSDGFFSNLNNKNAAAKSEYLQKTKVQQEIEKTKLNSFNNSRTHDYNNPAWEAVKWILDDD